MVEWCSGGRKLWLVISAILLLCLLTVTYWFGQYRSNAFRNSAATIDRLRSLASCKMWLDECSVELTIDDVQLARAYVFLHPDRTSYAILLQLRRLDWATYTTIPHGVRARILVDWLAGAKDLDSWGWLEDELPASMQDAGYAVLEVGDFAVPMLTFFLEDNTRISSTEGEVTAFYDDIVARRKDFAYKYICLIRNKRPFFSPDPKERDKRIDELRRELRPGLTTTD